MSLELAQWSDILPILKDNFSVWSRGLTQSDYRAFLLSQLRNPWLRSHLRYLVYKEGDKIAASCKVYQSEFVSKGLSLRFAGIAAVYTQKHLRNSGFAKKMIYAVIDDCKRREMDGLMLFSDIEPSFYETFGFMPMGSYDFSIDMVDENSKVTKVASTGLDDALQSRGFNVALNREIISQLTRHHARWLSRQPFGIARSEEYFLFKFAKEKFLAEHSKLNRPNFHISSLHCSTNEFAYAITEVAGKAMRVLEVVGAVAARTEVWSNLFDITKDLGLECIRGWESVVGDFAPGFTNYVSMPSHKSAVGTPKIECYERDWGKPMILPISKAARKLSDDWLSTAPCPLLELDFF
jgi:predicted N-acetyltransferase YhbS